MNLMDMIKGAVAQQAMDKLGGSLGMDAKKTGKAFETAAAVILGGIAKKAASGSDGSKAIFDMASKADSSMLDKLGDVMGGSGNAAEGYQTAGGGMLDAIMGGGKSGMISAIAKSLGLDDGLIGKLLTMVAPIVVGMIGKQVKSKGLDAGGLTSLLSTQAGSLSKFLPGSLSSDLGLSGLAAGAANAASGAANKAASAARAATNEATEAGGGLMKMLLPVIVIAAVAFGVWKLFLSNNNVVNNEINSAVQNAGQATNAVTSGVAELAEKLPSLDSLDFSALGETGTTLKNGFGEISTGLTGLAAPGADEAGAQGLSEKINSFIGKLDGLGLGSLDGVAKTASTAIIGTFLKSIEELIAKVPEPLRGIVQPAIGALVEKLNAFK